VMTEDNNLKDNAMAKTGSVEWYKSKIKEIKKIREARVLIHDKYLRIIKNNYIKECEQRDQIILAMKKRIKDLESYENQKG